MQLKHSFFLLAAFTAVPTIAASQSSEKRWETHPWATHAAVNTSSGTIIGHSAKDYPEVSEYLGIPFAQPPVGSLRFASPQPFRSTKSLVADTQPLSCIQAPAPINYSQPVNWQNIAANKGVFANHSSEDCLYLNIWTKKSQHPADNLKPVMVWFFGGGFHSGGAADLSEQGALFTAVQDIVAVNFNYRLSVFGFSGAPGETQNVGLLDQRLLLEWVHENIQAFGGDPDRITIFGYSAGGASVDLYNYAWATNPIIAASIAMSGTATTFGNRLPNTTTAAWYKTAELLGCGNSSSATGEKILSCMRSQSAELLFNASQTAGKSVQASLSTLGQTYAGITGVFGPMIDNHTVFANYSVRGKAGEFMQKPFLVGTNSDEACFFTMQGQIPVSDDPTINTGVFNCPVDWAAIYRAEKNVSVWKYDFEGSYPNLFAPACPGKPWHGSELNIFFGSSALATQQPATNLELQAGAYMRGAWAAFARDPNNGLMATSFGWPIFKPNEDEVVELGLNTTKTEAVGSAAARDAICMTQYPNGAPNF